MKKLLVLFVMPAILLSGCLTILNPLFEPDDYIFDPSFLGKWQKTSGDGEVIVEQGDNNTYKITAYEIKNRNRDTLTNTDGVYDTLRLECTMGRIGRNLYMDLSLADNAFNNNISLGGLGEYMILTHVFAKVIKSDTLRIQKLNMDWLEEGINKKKIRLETSEYVTGYSQDPGKKHEPSYSKTITASTKELQELIRKHGNSQAAFSNWLVLVKKK